MEKVDKNIYNSFEQLLIDSGYKIYPDFLYNSIRLFEKKVVDNIGIKYNIHVYHYNFSKKYPEQVNIPPGDSYAFKCQFQTGSCDDDSSVINIERSNNNKKTISHPGVVLRESEDFFEKMFSCFSFEYYEKNI
jgi:hypothetical protein